MVRITNSVYHEAYEYIKQDATGGNCMVFVSADVDSICAIRILQVRKTFVDTPNIMTLIFLSPGLVEK